MRKNLSIMTLAMMGTLLVVGPVLAEDLEGLLTQVGEEFGTAYASPFIEAFGPNQNSAMYQTAHIPWGGLKFGVGVKVMATHLDDSDKTFKRVLEDVDLGDYDPAFTGQTGDIIMEGPTVFGPTDVNGTITGYLHGIEVFKDETIPGLVETSFAPFLTPEIFVGGIFGLKGTLRYLPEMNMGDYGKTKYLGYGLQWSPNGLLPTFPIDVMVGFFSQDLTVGTLIDSTAKTYFLGVSKGVGIMTFYGGYAQEESEMTVTYVYEGDGSDVTFDASARQEDRFTLGATLGVLNVEMGLGDMTTYSAGIMFGF